MPFGKHAGTPLANVPADYLVYIYDNDYLVGNVMLRQYIKDNLDALKIEAKKIKSFRKSARR
jgi:uncharacterized protein (DUF3820 family)